MTKRIALFNHKGGVSKTTTTFNLGWMLAEKGKKVIMVDTDPQCNLTGMVLGYKGPEEFELFYKNEEERNIKYGLSPAFESRPTPIKAVNCVPVEGRKNLFLLPGHIGLSEYEVTLGIAQELSGSIQTLQNLPGAMPYLLDLTAKKFKADYVLIDMNPSLSSINQNLLTTSHFFIVPTTPDYFSVMAIDSLSSVLPNWNAWVKKVQSLPILRDAAYPFPKIEPKFIGTIIQNYRPRGKVPAKAFQKWINEINDRVRKNFVPTLERIDMLLPIEKYKEQNIGSGICLATISDFNALIAQSQRAGVPVFRLKPSQIGQSGVVLERTLKARDRFEKIFKELANRIIGLTTDGPNN